MIYKLAAWGIRLTGLASYCHLLSLPPRRGYKQPCPTLSRVEADTGSRPSFGNAVRRAERLVLLRGSRIMTVSCSLRHRDHSFINAGGSGGLGQVQAHSVCQVLIVAWAGLTPPSPCQSLLFSVDLTLGWEENDEGHLPPGFPF